MEWFPRAFGLMLVVLAGTFILDLFRTEPGRNSPNSELCGRCVRANEHPKEEIPPGTFCDFSPINRTCPQCGRGWHRNSPNLQELVDDPGAGRCSA